MTHLNEASMKDQEGRGVIRLGDKTTHGGEVISATADFIVLGKQVAVEGDLTYCPKCKGKFPIQPSGSSRKHHDKQVAYDQDPTACGAKLVSSL
jgi:uncharacterized Zn-binding protein involved in type VI secretion